MAAFIRRRACRHGEAFIQNITVKTMPEMLRKLIPKDVNPAFICTSYSHNKDKYNKALKLSEKEQQLLLSLSSEGFQNCDTPLLFKLCQYFDFVTAPKEGWGKFDDKFYNIGDAVEAIVRLRYENLRNPNEDLIGRFEKLVEIAKVVDKEISTDKTFEDAVKSLFGNASSIEKCKTAFQKIVDEAANGTFEDDVLEENESMCFDEDYHPNVWQKRIVLSPALFGKTGNDSRTEINYANELIEKVCKTRASKVIDELPCSRKSVRIRKRESSSN